MREFEQIIAEHPFFARLAPEHQRFIAGCGQLASYKAGEFLQRAGAEAVHFFLIRRGRVALELTPPGSDPFIFQTVTVGEIVGWSWLFEPHVVQFDGRVLERTSVIRFDGECLRGKCDADPKLGFDLMRLFAKVLVQRYADTRLQLLDVYGRRS